MSSLAAPRFGQPHSDIYSHRFQMRTHMRGVPVAGTIKTSKHHDLIYDVGLHKGEDTEFYLRKGFRVVAFEADPDLVRSCRDRLCEFIDRGRLTIVEGAIIEPAQI